MDRNAEKNFWLENVGEVNTVVAIWAGREFGPAIVVFQKAKVKSIAQH